MPETLLLSSPEFGDGVNMSYVYFPTTSLVSLLYVMEDGASVEIAITGNCSLVGISLFMGGETTPNRAVVQGAGDGYRLGAHAAKKEFAMPLQGQRRISLQSIRL